MFRNVLRVAVKLRKFQWFGITKYAVKLANR